MLTRPSGAGLAADSAPPDVAPRAPATEEEEAEEPAAPAPRTVSCFPAREAKFGKLAGAPNLGVALMTGEFVEFERLEGKSFIAQIVDVVPFELLSKLEQTEWRGCEHEMMVRVRWCSVVGGGDGRPCAARSHVPAEWGLDLQQEIVVSSEYGLRPAMNILGLVVAFAAEDVKNGFFYIKGQSWAYIIHGIEDATGAVTTIDAEEWAMQPEVSQSVR